MAGSIDEFECAIHLGPFEKPKLLDCHHTFCEKCLEQLAGANLVSNRNAIKCPLCKKISQVPAGGVKDFATNFHLSAPSTSSAGRDDKQCCSKHPREEVKYFCEDCNTILCSTCLLEQHKNHKHLIIEESGDAFLKDFKDQRDGLKRKLEELKKVTEIAEESLKTLTEYRHAELNTFQTDIQKNYDENCEKLSTVLRRVNSLKSQAEKIFEIDPDDGKMKPIDVLHAVLFMKTINKLPSQAYFPPIYYLKVKKDGGEPSSVGRLERVKLSIPYTMSCETWRESTTQMNPLLQPGQVEHLLTIPPPPIDGEEEQSKTQNKVRAIVILVCWIILIAVGIYYIYRLVA